MEKGKMNIKVLFGVLALLGCSAASADELGARLAGGVIRAPAAMLYLEFPLAARHHEGPAFGLRMESSPRADLASLRQSTRAATLVDVRFNNRRDETETHAVNMLGKGAIIGIVVGAVVVVAAASDSGSGGGGGGY
jgi:hypothetical protein